MIRAHFPSADTRPDRRRRARCRRGAIYAVVLGMAMLVALIGLSAVAVGRVTLRRTASAGDGLDADLLARSAVEHAAAAMNTNSSWRTSYGNDLETPPVSLGRGAFTWKLVDEADGSLSTGGAQPVRVYGFGRVGEARRCFSVEFAPGGTNLLDNSGTELSLTNWATAGDCVLESHVNEPSDSPHTGQRFIWVRGRAAATAGPQQDVTLKVSGGKSYYCEAWLRMKLAPEDAWLVLVCKKAGQLDTVYKVRTKTAGTEWTKVSGTLNPSFTGLMDTILWRIETAGTAQEFQFDDVQLVEGGASAPMVPSADTWRQDPLP